MNATTALEVEGLAVSYGAVRAVDSVDVRVAPGECVAVLGANGAGKTSLLSGVMGIASSRGRVRLGDKDVSGRPAHARVRAGLALVPEGRRIIGSLTVAENLRLGAYWASRDVEGEQRERVFSLFPVLGKRYQQVAGTLSGGEQQMLAIARALMVRPQVLLMDEPTIGLAPRIVSEVLDSITSVLASQGVGLVLVEQNARAALTVSDRAYVMKLGRVALTGPAAEVADSPALHDAYLGL